MEEEYSTTSFGINIGTGLMLESILDSTSSRIDDTRERPNKVDLSKYDIYYINVDSLLANIISSYSSTIQQKILDLDNTIINMVVNKAIDEMSIISNMLKIKLVYYTMSYKTYRIKQLIRDPKPNTKVLKLKKSIEILSAKLVKSNEVEVKEFDIFLDTKGKILISTSNPVDLLNVSRVTSLDLLEFHTGVLKQRNLFYTKLNTPIELPYQEVILFITGDKKGFVTPVVTAKEKKQILEILQKKDLKSYKNYSRKFILDMILTGNGMDVIVHNIKQKVPTAFGMI